MPNEPVAQLANSMPGGGGANHPGMPDKPPAQFAQDMIDRGVPPQDWDTILKYYGPQYHTAVARHLAKMSGANSPSATAQQPPLGPIEGTAAGATSRMLQEVQRGEEDQLYPTLADKGYTQAQLLEAMGGAADPGGPRHNIPDVPDSTPGVEYSRQRRPVIGGRNRGKQDPDEIHGHATGLIGNSASGKSGPGMVPISAMPAGFRDAVSRSGVNATHWNPKSLPPEERKLLTDLVLLGAQEKAEKKKSEKKKTVVASNG